MANDVVTDEEAKTVGLRALAAGFPRQRWDGPAYCHHLSPWRSSAGVLWRGGNNSDDRWPDFRDDASRGVLLGRVRERWGDPSLGAESVRLRDKSVAWSVGNWSGVGCAMGDSDEQPTEAAALIAALEAAP